MIYWILSQSSLPEADTRYLEELGCTILYWNDLPKTINSEIERLHADARILVCRCEMFYSQFIAAKLASRGFDVLKIKESYIHGDDNYDLIVSPYSVEMRKFITRHDVKQQESV